MYATSWRCFTSRKSFLLMSETWIHLNLKMIEILKDQTQKINTCLHVQVNSRNTRTRCHLFKINNDHSRAIISFCLGVDWVPWYRLKANIYLLKVNNMYTRIRCGTCSKFNVQSSKCSINPTEPYQWRRNDFIIDNFEYVSLFILVFLLLTICLLDLTWWIQHSIIRRDFQSEKSFVSQLFLFEKIGGVTH